MLVTAFLAIAMSGCGSPATSALGPAEVQVVVVTPVKRPIVEWDEYVGRLEAVELVEVRARVSGYLQSIHFAEGQLVKRGDLLFVVDPRPFEAELAKAQAELEQATARVAQSIALTAQADAEKKKADANLFYATSKFERAKGLVQSNNVTKDEFDQIRSELHQAEAQLEGAKAQIAGAKAANVTAKAAIETAASAIAIAKLNLEYTQIVAPISGRISKHEITEGNLISGGTLQSTLLTTIVSVDPIHCYFDADESEFLKYTRLAQEGKRQSSRDVKNPVYMALSDEKVGFPHLGHMDFVDNRLDTNTGTMRGRAIFRNTDASLTPGLFARLRLPGSARYDAVLLPDSAIGNDQAEKFVFVVDEQNKLRRQPVTIGPMSHGLRVVRSGLTGSERVVHRGLQRVRPGLEVTTIEDKIEAKDTDGLPDEYVPVPKEKWIRQPNGKHTAAGGSVQPAQQQPPAKQSDAPSEPAKSDSETPPRTSPK